MRRRSGSFGSASKAVTISLAAESGSFASTAIFASIWRPIEDVVAIVVNLRRTALRSGGVRLLSTAVKTISCRILTERPLCRERILLQPNTPAATIKRSVDNIVINGSV